MSESKAHSWNAYFVVFNALLLLTVLTVGLSYFDIGELLSAGSLFGAETVYGLRDTLHAPWLPLPHRQRSARATNSYWPIWRPSPRESRPSPITSPPS